MVSCALFVFYLVKTEPVSSLAWTQLVLLRALYDVNFRKISVVIFWNENLIIYAYIISHISFNMYAVYL
jgi:hypothetical protein